MNKRDSRKVIAVGAALVALSPAVVRAATVNLNVEAVLTTGGLVLNQNQGLDFGTFTAVGAGSVAIDPAGGVVNTGVTQVAGSTPSQAILEIKRLAGPGPNVIITVTDPTIQLTNGTSTMQVNQFQVNTAAGGVVETVNMASTTINVPIGGTLTVGPAQPSGTYNGVFTVQVVHQ